MKKIDALIILTIVIFGFVLPLAIVIRHENDTILITAKIPEDGGWSLKEINAKVGDNLTLRIISNDVTHSFQIIEFGIDVVLYPNHIVEINIPTDTPGRFIFKCNVRCSPQHYYMTGILVISS